MVIKDIVCHVLVSDFLRIYESRVESASYAWHIQVCYPCSCPCFIAIAIVTANKIDLGEPCLRGLF